MINYAHRGASEYAPENTLSAFYLGLLQGANGIETDIQKTKDGVPVLFHDETVDRVSDGVGRVCDYSLEDIKRLKIYGKNTTGFYDNIVTLNEFLDKFSRYNIHFAIELKGMGVEEDTVAAVKQFGIMDKTTFTSFSFDYIKRLKDIEPMAKISWLVSNPDDKLLNKLIDIGGEELEPEAKYIDEDLIKKCRKKGIGIRAWGVYDVEIMKKMCNLKIDGMTVNFPDRLFQYLSLQR